MPDKDNKLFIQCDCGSEFILIDHDDEFNEAYFCILAYEYSKPSFWHRFRHIWRCLKYGTPYTDNVCLTKEKVKEMKDKIDIIYKAMSKGDK